MSDLTPADRLAAIAQVHESEAMPTSTHYFCGEDDCDRAGEGELRQECVECHKWAPCPTRLLAIGP